MRARRPAAAARSLAHTPEAIAAWAAGLARDFSNQPVAVMLEQSRGARLQALTQYPSSCCFLSIPSKPPLPRSLVHSGKKGRSDRCECLARFGPRASRQLRAWKRKMPLTRQLAQLVELRRRRSNHASRPPSSAQPRLKRISPGAGPRRRALLRGSWNAGDTTGLGTANPAALRKFSPSMAAVMKIR